MVVSVALFKDSINTTGGITVLFTIVLLVTTETTSCGNSACALLSFRMVVSSISSNSFEWLVFGGFAVKTWWVSFFSLSSSGN